MMSEEEAVWDIPGGDERKEMEKCVGDCYEEGDKEKREH